MTEMAKIEVHNREEKFTWSVKGLLPRAEEQKERSRLCVRRCVCVWVCVCANKEEGKWGGRG